MGINKIKIVFFTGIMLAAGCGDGGDTTNAGSGTATPSGDPQTDIANAIQIQCELLNRCLGPFLEITYGDVATCKARGVLEIKDPASYEGSTTTSVDIVNCANALKTADCSLLQGDEPPAACKIKAGTLADGKSCIKSLQCQSTHCKQIGSDCGVCGQKSAAGEPCSNSQDCAEGLKCIQGAQESVCGAPVVVGGKCTGGDCIPGYACVNDICVLPETKAGQPCSSGAQCDSFAGLLCHPLTKVCTAIKQAEAGASCGLLENDYVACKGGGKCKIPQGKTSGSCVAAAADGAACDPEQGIDCLEPAECTNGLCKLPVEPVCK